jgi:hypothetical protein
MPILGTIASSYLQATSSFESIASVLVGSGGQSGVEFTSIPSTYKHLQIRGVARQDFASSNQRGCRMQFNADTGNNYGAGQTYYNGSTQADEFYTPTDVFYLGEWPGPGRTTGVFFHFVIDIHNYADTSMFKNAMSYGFYQSFSQGGFAQSGGGIWRNTSAVTSIKLFEGANANLTQNTRISLYGIKG